MKNQSVNRFPKGTAVCLALLLIVIAVLAGYDGNPAAAAAESDVMSTASSDELVWVRQDPPIINVNNDPTYWESSPEDRFAGSYGEYTVTETEIAYHERWVDHGYEWYDVTLKTNFDRPPIVLNPPLRYKITATASHDGTHNMGSIGYQFWYNSPYGAVIEPKEVLGYYPFADEWDGTSSKEWMINPPAILGEGDSFEMYAGWWNCPPCNVTWTYKAEPANAVERLGVEVLQPVVTYQGEEVSPGETYYPETCPDPTRMSADTCFNRHELKKEAKVALKCTTDAVERLLLLLDLLEVREAFDDEPFALENVIMNLAGVELYNDCELVVGPAGEASRLEVADAYQLDLALEEGAMQLSNVADGLTTSVQTPLGAAYTASRGTFMTGYDPKINAAIFRAYSTPLLLEPKSGSTMVLRSHHQVTLTSEGFGPVTELPRVFLPLVTNPR